MSAHMSMIGRVFTELTVLELDRIDNHFVKWYKCQCSCGAIRIVCIDKLRGGRVKRCVDCQAAWRWANATEKYKRALELYGRTYFIWKSMKQRCTNPNNKDYLHYMGRNIGIEDPRWLIYEEFIADMGEAPKGLQIDRIDNNRGYCKENCRWTTPTVQNNNKRPKSRHKKRITNQELTEEEERSWKSDQLAMLLS